MRDTCISFHCRLELGRNIAADANVSLFAARLFVKFRSLQMCSVIAGTPVHNSIEDLWSLLTFLTPHLFGSVHTFTEWCALHAACGFAA